MLPGYTSDTNNGEKPMSISYDTRIKPPYMQNYSSEGQGIVKFDLNNFQSFRCTFV